MYVNSALCFGSDPRGLFCPGVAQLPQHSILQWLSGFKRRSSRQQRGTSSPLSTAIADHFWRVYHPGIYPGPLSLADPPWVGATSTGDGCGHLWEETAPLKLRRYGNKSFYEQNKNKYKYK